MQKIYNLEETELEELLEEICSRPQPLYTYQYDDGENSWFLWSDVEINEDDVENVFQERIKDTEEEEEFYDDLSD